MNYLRYLFFVGLIAGQLFKSSDVVAAVDEALYNQKVFELSAILYGVTEIGAKSCKGAGTKIPDSLEKWNTAVNEYMKGETTRDGTLVKQHEDLTAKMKAADTSKSAGKQVEVYQLGIESLDASIKSISGNGGRISLRQKLLAAINEALKANDLEDKKERKAYAELNDTDFPEAISSAQAACERKKIITECVTDDAGAKNCTSKEVSDPVPGCDVAIAELTKLKSGTVTLYGNIYVINFVPSTELNDKMEAMEKEMKTTVATIPRSTDANYDWTTAVESGITLVETTRKEAGIKCPSSADKKSFNRAELDTIVPEKNSSGAMPTSVSSGTQNFLSKIGTTNSSPSVVSAFTETWNTADMVVGQAGQRSGYFNYVKDRVDALLSMDQTYLTQAQDTRKKFADYAGNVNSNLDHGANITGDKTTSTKSGVLGIAPTITGASAIGHSGATSVSVFANSVDPSIKKGSTQMGNINGANPGASAIGKLSTDSSNGASGIKNANGASGSSTKNNSRLAGSGKESSGGVSVAAGEGAVDSSSRKTSKDSRQASSGKSNTGDDEVLKKSLDGIFDKLKDAPDSPALYKTASISGKSEDYDGLTGFENSGVVNDPTRSKRADIVYKIPFQDLRGLRSSRETKNVTVSKEKTESTIDSVISPRQVSGQKFKDMDMYKSNDNDTLFEKVTKAYIRNYEQLELP